jgi:hypothetical protein
MRLPQKPQTFFMLNKETILRDEMKLHADVGEHIGYELGAKMVKDYYDKYKENTYQFVGKNIIQEILAQPGCIGINILRALNENGEKTYVLLGVNEEGKPIFEIPAVNTFGELKVQEGIVADRNVEVPGWLDFLK